MNGKDKKVDRYAVCGMSVGSRRCAVRIARERETLNPKPAFAKASADETRNLEPETRNQSAVGSTKRDGTRNLEPETLNPEPAFAKASADETRNYTLPTGRAPSVIHSLQEPAYKPASPKPA